MEYHKLRLSLEPPIARIVLGRTGDENRIETRLLRELRDATQTIATAEDISLTLIESEGPDFCLGWEPVTRLELQRSWADTASLDPFGCLADLACPVLAVVQGRAFGAGLELALAADIRVCAEDARFALPEIEDGRLPLAGGSQRLPRTIGRSRGAAMLLLAEELDAPSALAAGLVSRVFPAAGLTAEANTLAGAIASRGPIALRYAKEAVHNGLEMTLEHGLRYELDLSIILQTTSDRAEGVQAFLEKRPPEFTGQ